MSEYEESGKMKLAQVQEELNELEKYLPGAKGIILKVAKTLAPRQRASWEQMCQATLPARSEFSKRKVLLFFKGLDLVEFAKKRSTKKKWPELLEIYKDLSLCTSVDYLQMKYAEISELDPAIQKVVEINLLRIQMPLLHIQAMTMTFLQGRDEMDPQKETRLKNIFANTKKLLLEMTEYKLTL